MKLTPGTVFANDYEVIRELSTGGMGTVYVVLQRSTGKQRALKLMLPHFVADATLRRRFEQEAKVASLVESDHVVEVVGAGIDEPSGSPWLAMELLKGAELSAAIVLASPDPALAAHAILRQVCHAVGAAHAAGIVHRDLKPANIFLADSKRAGETRTVKVLDFGIAKIAAEAMTQNTAAIGSPIWMAPEQSSKGAITPAADVWSLGLIAYNLFTNKYFWHAAEASDGTIHQVMREVLFDPIPPASQRAAEQGAPLLPPWFDVWFSRCVARDPLLRFPDATAAFAAFDASHGGLTITAPSMPILTLPSNPPPSVVVRNSATQMGAGMTQPGLSVVPPRSRARWLVPLFGVLAIGGISAFAWQRRYAHSHVDAPPPVVDVPSATADIPTDSDVEPAPPLLSASGSASKKKVKPGAHPSASASQTPATDLSAELAKIGNTQPPPQRSDGQFDRAGAVIQLDRVNLQVCATTDGPKGPSHVRVVFGNDGHARNFVYDPRGPYANTPAETCITDHLRLAHVAPFIGPPQMVSREVNLR